MAKCKYIKPLIIKCNAVLRVLQDKTIRFHVSNLYNNCNTLPVNLLYKFNTLKLMHRILNYRNSIPTTISKLFVANYEVHKYYTRFNFDFNLVYDCSHNSIAYRAPVMWRKLSIKTRICTCSSEFARLCKLELLEEI